MRNIIRFFQTIGYNLSKHNYLEHGTDPKKTPRCWEIGQLKDEKNLQWLLKRQEVLIALLTLCNDDGRTIFHIIAYNINKDIIALANQKSICEIFSNLSQQEAYQKMLRDAVNCKDQTSAQRTPLHYACYFGDLPVVQWMIGLGAKVSIKDATRKDSAYYANAAQSNKTAITGIIRNALEAQAARQELYTLLLCLKHIASNSSHLRIPPTITHYIVAPYVSKRYHRTPQTLSSTNTRSEHNSHKSA